MQSFDVVQQTKDLKTTKRKKNAKNFVIFFSLCFCYCVAVVFVVVYKLFSNVFFLCLFPCRKQIHKRALKENRRRGKKANENKLIRWNQGEHSLTLELHFGWMDICGESNYANSQRRRGNWRRQTIQRPRESQLNRKDRYNRKRDKFIRYAFFVCCAASKNYADRHRPS